MIPMNQEQLGLLAERLGALGVRRREFLAVASALAGGVLAHGVIGPLPQAYGQAALPPGVKLAKEQVYRWPLANEPSSLDLNRYLYGGADAGLWAWLMKFDPNYKPMPWLAERFEASPKGDVYTFYLRPGLKWSNGDPLTAQDFVWSYQRKLDPATAADYPGFFYDIKNAQKINKGDIKDLTQLGVQAKDDMTLEFTLEGPRGYFHVLMAYAATAPAHKATVEKHGDKWTEPGNIVSNGMYVLEGWEHNKQVVLKKNPLYFEKDKILLERVVRPIIASPAQLLAYENNEIDFVEVPAAHFKRIQADAKLSKEMIPYDAPITWYLTPQVTHPPFDDVRVRRAVSHAIDRKVIAEKVIQGMGMPAHAYIPPGLPGHIDAAKHPKYVELQRFDPKLAVEALKGTKYEGAKNWPKITLTMREEGPNPKAMAEAIQAMLAQNLRMTVELEVLEQRVFRERLWKLDLQFIFIRWFADYPDPHNEYYDTLYSKLAGGRRQAWSNAEFDALLEKGREELDWQKRLEIYMKAEEILQQDVGYVPVVWGLFFGMFKPWVQGQPRNSREQIMVDGNIYRWAREHIYIVEHS